mgnify:CR=1 FL=1
MHNPETIRWHIRMAITMIRENRKEHEANSLTHINGWLPDAEEKRADATFGVNAELVMALTKLGEYEGIPNDT